MPTEQRAGSSGGGRSTCAVSLRQGVYWIGRGGTPTGINKYQLDDGSLRTSIPFGSVVSMEKTADQKFLVLTGISLITVNTQSDDIVESDYVASLASVCDDGTIISADTRSSPAILAKRIVEDSGEITNLGEVDVEFVVVAIGCSPGSTFVVVTSYDEISSFAVSSLTVVDTLPTTDSVISIAFNPATSDVYLLHYNGKLSVYAFNSDGTFGVSKASTDIGFVHTSSAGTVLEFAYGKLFVHAADQLLTYDAALNLKSSQTIVTGKKSATCVSEGTRFCVLCVFVKLIKHLNM
jgi:WD40 repeat protein